MLAPVLERLAAKSNGEWVLAKVDRESFPDIAARYIDKNNDLSKR
jgi:thioredoxin-like negative regulator of GroEL